MNLHEDKDEDEDDTRILGICINEWHRLFLRQRERDTYHFIYVGLDFGRTSVIKLCNFEIIFGWQKTFSFTISKDLNDRRNRIINLCIPPVPFSKKNYDISRVFKWTLKQSVETIQVFCSVSHGVENC